MTLFPNIFLPSRNRHRPIADPSGSSEVALIIKENNIIDEERHGLKVWHSGDADIVDVVFVHGLTGHRDETWTADSRDRPWPVELLPEFFPNARLMTFGYNADVVKFGRNASLDRLPGHANVLLQHLVGERDGLKSRPLLFVCHSLGGLVCKNALLLANEKSVDDEDYRKIYEDTRGILFFGTPHKGADLAGVASTVLGWVSPFQQSDREILDYLKPGSEVLAVLTQRFYALIQQRVRLHQQAFNIHCFYETEGMGPMRKQVVSQESAIFGGYHTVGIPGDHMTMVKFWNSNNSGFRSFRSTLLQWINKIKKEKAEEQRADRERQGAEMEEFKKSLEIVDISGPSIENRKEPEFSWLLQNPKYLQWTDCQAGPPIQFLLIKGKPGSGKTLGLKAAEKSLGAEDESRFVLAHYFDARQTDATMSSTSTHAMYRMLMQKVVDCHPAPLRFRKYWESIYQGCWRIGRLERALSQLLLEKLEHHTTFFLIIDALDECKPIKDHGADHGVSQMLEFFRQTFDQILPTRVTIRICLSVRHYHDSELAIPEGDQIIVEDHNERNIDNFVEHEMRALKSLGEKRKLQRIVKEKAQGCFQWVKFVMKKIMSRILKESYEELLQHVMALPEDLEELYNHSLNEKDSGHRTECCKLLQLLLVARESLQVSEVRHALALLSLQDAEVVTKWTQLDTIVSDQIEFSDRITMITGGLVHLERVSSTTGQTTQQGSEDSVVRFMHHTVREFLVQTMPTIKGRSYSNKHTEHDVEIQSHYAWFRLCMVVLQIAIPGGQTPPRLRQYALRFWMGHAREAESLLDVNYRYPALLTKCFKGTDKLVEQYISTVQNNSTQNSLQLYNETNFFVLLAAEGCAHLMECHLKSCSVCKSQLAAPDGKSDLLDRALYQACAHGRLNAVDLFQRWGRSGNASHDGISALYNACSNGRVEIAEKLLTMSAPMDVEGQREYYGLPLQAAAVCDHKEIIKMLVRHPGVDKERILPLPNARGKTALHLAAEHDCMNSARLLLENVKDQNVLILTRYDGETALEIAERCGHAELAEKLEEYLE